MLFTGKRLRHVCSQLADWRIFFAVALLFDTAPAMNIVNQLHSSADESEFYMDICWTELDVQVDVSA